MSKFMKNSRIFAKFCRKIGKISEIGEKFNRKIQYFNPVLGRHGRREDGARGAHLRARRAPPGAH